MNVLIMGENRVKQQTRRKHQLLPLLWNQSCYHPQSTQWKNVMLHDVASMDIPGAFMQADIDQVVHVKLEGEIAKLLVKMVLKLYKSISGTSMGKQCYGLIS